MDAVGAMLLGAILAAVSHWPANAQPWRHDLDSLGFALIGIAAWSLAIRRIWPELALGITIAATAAYLAAGYPYGPIYVATLFGIYSVAVRLPTVRSLVGCGVALVAYGLAGAFSVGPTGAGRLQPLANVYAARDFLVFGAFVLLVPWALGTLFRARRESTTRTREEEARRRAYEQRLEIVREVHDVVGHGLAVINMQAGVALHVLDRRPEQGKVALEAIRDSSKEALEELRATLAVFRQPDEGGASRRPTPGLDQVDTLVTAMGDGGLSVDLVVDGDRATVPASVDQAAYRIVQESLTNVLRHAGSTAATVRIGYRGGDVEVDVTDSGRARPGAPIATDGHGIAGMRERAAAVGGTLDAGPRAEGGFRVHAVLPLGAPAG
ncbi:MAG TPA: histidine kinase [Candidatus Binatia bacterium]|nr:histidine kinase [Candidatus Binatia bacterium]